MGTYLITGATGGIGGAAAELLRDRGHELILTGRSPERLAAVQARLSGGAHARTQEFRQVSADRAAGPSDGGRGAGHGGTATDTRVTTLPLDLGA
ncbi:SDR family NAD(P)-dependent oxidoreductase, partial [Actinomadura logoneensis]